MKIVALAGGVGGAKLAHGLARALAPEQLTIIVNTGDDFVHWGLNISPDLDTVCYALAGLANPETGWGRAGESWAALTAMRAIGAPDWFQIGDRDLATHLERTRRLRAGESLSEVTWYLRKAWGISAAVLPMTDDPVATIVQAEELGDLPFQEYFVRLKCAPRVTGFRFAGMESARPAPGVLEAISASDAVVICPSNPWVSIDPILALPDLREAAGQKTVVAVSPIIGGQTVKGPAAKMFAELGIQPSAIAVAQHYQPILSGFVLDAQDSALAPAIEMLGVRTWAVDTLMTNEVKRELLARDVLHFVERLLP